MLIHSHLDVKIWRILRAQVINIFEILSIEEPHHVTPSRVQTLATRYCTLVRPLHSISSAFAVFSVVVPGVLVLVWQRWLAYTTARLSLYRQMAQDHLYVFHYYPL